MRVRESVSALSLAAFFAAGVVWVSGRVALSTPTPLQPDGVVLLDFATPFRGAPLDARTAVAECLAAADAIAVARLRGSATRRPQADRSFALSLHHAMELELESPRWLFGSLADSERVVESCAGETAEDCAWMGDRTRRVLLLRRVGDQVRLAARSGCPRGFLEGMGPEELRAELAMMARSDRESDPPHVASMVVTAVDSLTREAEVDAGLRVLVAIATLAPSRVAEAVRDPRRPGVSHVAARLPRGVAGIGPHFDAATGVEWIAVSTVGQVVHLALQAATPANPCATFVLRAEPDELSRCSARWARLARALDGRLPEP